MTETAGVRPRRVDDRLPIGFPEIATVPVIGTRIDPAAGMGAAFRWNRSLDHPARELLSIAFVEQLRMTFLLQNRQNGSRFVGRQRRRLAFWVWNATDRE